METFFLTILKKKILILKNNVVLKKFPTEKPYQQF